MLRHVINIIDGIENVNILNLEIIQYSNYKITYFEKLKWKLFLHIFTYYISIFFYISGNVSNEFWGDDEWWFFSVF